MFSAIPQIVEPIGYVDLSAQQAQFVLNGAFIGLVCFMSQFALIVAFMLVMIASGKWDVIEQKEKVLNNSSERERVEALYREAGYSFHHLYFDPERGNKMVLVFSRRRIKLFKGML